MPYFKPILCSISGWRRDWAKREGLYLTGRNRNNAHQISKAIKIVDIKIRDAKKKKRKVNYRVKTLRKLRRFLMKELMVELTNTVDVAAVPLPMHERGPSAIIDDWNEERITIDFPVDNTQQLRDLMTGLQFPAVMVSPYRVTFTGEEVFLFGLFRLHNLGKYTSLDIATNFGFTHSSYCSQAFHLFLNFIVGDWGYLVTDNLDFWVPYFPECADAIREECLHNGVLFNDRFMIFGFVDNTMHKTCRVGGGATTPGPNAPREPKELQQAWYNGWKKLHGLKWETVDLPNGMIAFAWGPVSVRHNDLFTLRHSKLNDLIRDCQLGLAVQYAIYGDSAYQHCRLSHLRARHNYDDITPHEQSENRVMSTVRETIEWSYKDMGQMFPLLNVDQILKVRSMPVGKMYQAAMIFKNCINCFRHNQTSQYYHLNPPNLETYLSQGPRARPNVIPIIPDIL